MFLLLTVICILQPSVVWGKSCGRENVSGAEGGEVTLRVLQTGIKFIDWILLPEGNVIATTGPGGYIDDKRVRSQYRGRVRSEGEGSLHLSNLSLQDQGIYRANILTTEDKELCAEFNLTVYERLSPGDIKITPILTSNDTCSLGLSCTVDKPDVTITWSNAQGSDINVTRGVLYVPPSGVNFTYNCSSSNPVSNVSKSVIPREYCERDKKESLEKHERVYFALIAVFLVPCIIFVLHKVWIKRRKKHNEPSTTYAETGQGQTGTGNVYQQSQEPRQDNITLYSEVQHAKKTNSQKKQNGKEANATSAVESVYSTVTSPQETNSQQKKTGKEANLASAIETVYSTVASPKV